MMILKNVAKRNLWVIELNLDGDFKDLDSYSIHILESAMEFNIQAALNKKTTPRWVKTTPRWVLVGLAESYTEIQDKFNEIQLRLTKMQKN